ncbi:MAG: hypothetical protein M3463_13580, partial [Verrucomicrobiota bacterium]|nr:hypothetical protein [Verrucomicrobiota bacterium]
MNRLSKAILIILGAAGVAVVTVLVGLNLYVQSPGAQARIEEELSRALRVPLRITNITLTLWGDLRINGITVPAEEGNFLEAASFGAHYRLLPLLRKQLLISEMRMERPRISWTQNAEGRWVLPTRSGEPAGPGKPVAGEKASRPKKSDFEVRIEGFKIIDGAAELLDRDGKQVASLTGAELNYTTLTAERVEGTARIARLVYLDALHFENLQTPFRYAGNQLELPEIRAQLGGGEVEGRFTMHPKAPDSPLAARLELSDVDVERLTREANWTQGQISGRLSGTAEFGGSSRRIERLKGTGAASVADAHFRHLEFFRTIGDILKISELADLRVSDAHTAFRIENQKVYFEKLLLASPDVKLSANGVARFDKKLKLNARLAVSERTLKQLPQWVHGNMTPGEDPGLRGIDFEITGKTDKPKTDLLNR